VSAAKLVAEPGAATEKFQEHASAKIATALHSTMVHVGQVLINF